MNEPKTRNIDYLNGMLFDQMERLETTTGDELHEEISRSIALIKTAKELVSAGKLALQAYDLAGGQKAKLPALVSPVHQGDQNIF